MVEGRQLKVIIAGAGIAGLATAIALRQLPYIDVQLYERYSELKEIGASIALSPNVCIQQARRLVLTRVLGHAHARASWRL